MSCEVREALEEQLLAAGVVGIRGHRGRRLLVAPTINTRRKATGGLPDHETPFDAHICALNLQNLLKYLEIM